MKRWSATSEKVEAPKVDVFLAEVLEVCAKHGFCIGHEDGHGAFLIEPFDPETAKWLMEAHLGQGLDVVVHKDID